MMNETEISLREDGSSIASDGESVDSGVVVDYKLLYDQEVDRRKTLLKLAQKATRDYDELKLRYLDSTQTIEALRLRLEESEHELKNLQNVSEAVYHEYDSLKTRYEVESDTMAKAFNRATEWYNENKSLRRETAALRRQSALFIQKLSDDVDFGELSNLTDNSTNIDDNLERQHENEIASLMSKIKDLEAEVAALNTELSKVRADEFDAQEEIMELRKQMEQMEDELVMLKERVRELEGAEQRLGKVSEMVLLEVEELEAKLKSEASRADSALSDAAEARRKHAAISRQSAIMISQATDDERLTKSLQDINELTTKLIHEREQHQHIVSQMKHEMQEMMKNTDQREEINLLKEKCNLMEQEAIDWQRKHMKSVSDIDFLQNKISSLMESHQEEAKRCEEPESPPRDLEVPLPPSIPTAPPPPSTIPPPPPPPPPSPNPVVTLAAMIGVSKKSMKPVEAETTKAPAMDDLIDQIKRGGIQLKQTPKSQRNVPKIESRRAFPVKKISPAKSEGNAIQEMKTILASMNRSRSGRVRPSAIAPKKCRVPNESESEPSEKETREVSKDTEKLEAPEEELTTSTDPMQHFGPEFTQSINQQEDEPIPIRTPSNVSIETSQSELQVIPTITSSDENHETDQSVFPGETNSPFEPIAPEVSRPTSLKECHLVSSPITPEVSQSVSHPETKPVLESQSSIDEDIPIPRVKDKINKLNIASTGHIFGTPLKSTLEIRLGNGRSSKPSSPS